MHPVFSENPGELHCPKISDVDGTDCKNHDKRAMKDKYIDLIEQTFDFPQDEFSVEDNELNFHDIPLMELIKQYGTPLKITYLPKISHTRNAYVAEESTKLQQNGRNVCAVVICT